MMHEKYKPAFLGIDNIISVLEIHNPGPDLTASCNRNNSINENFIEHA